MLDDDSHDSHGSVLDSEYFLLPRSNNGGTNPSSLVFYGDRTPDTVIRYNDGEICRICLNTGTIPIFGSEDLCKDIEHFACIYISKSDGLPQHLCSACRDILATAVSFRRNAQKSDNILRKSAVAECERESQCASLPYVVDEDNSDENTIEGTSNEQSDEENSNGGVYLECHNTVYHSDGESQISKTDATASLNDDASISDTEIEPDELEHLVNDLKKHQRDLRCEICLVSFRTIEQIDEHSSEHDSDARKCEVCQNIILKSLYDIHIKVHREAFNERLKKKYTKVECTVCQKFVSKTYLKQHMMLHGSDEVKQERYRTCTICNVNVSKRYLPDHIKLKHSKKKSSRIIKQMCPICLQMIKETSYKDHVSSHAYKPKKLICEVCGKEFYHGSSFKTHQLTHKNVYSLKCQFCPYQAKHLGLLKIHVRTHTKDYPYKCTTCDKSFITKSNLSAHQRIHGTPLRYMCSECGQTFTGARSLLAHDRTIHLNIRDFKCDLCGRAYGKKDALVAHQKKAHGVRFQSQVGRTPSYLAERMDEENV